METHSGFDVSYGSEEARMTAAVVSVETAMARVHFRCRDHDEGGIDAGGVEAITEARNALDALWKAAAAVEAIGLAQSSQIAREAVLQGARSAQARYEDRAAQLNGLTAEIERSEALHKEQEISRWAEGQIHEPADHLSPASQEDIPDGPYLDEDSAEAEDARDDDPLYGNSGAYHEVHHPAYTDTGKTPETQHTRHLDSLPHNTTQDYQTLTADSAQTFLSTHPTNGAPNQQVDPPDHHASAQLSTKTFDQPVPPQPQFHSPAIHDPGVAHDSLNFFSDPAQPLAAGIDLDGAVPAQNEAEQALFFSPPILPQNPHPTEDVPVSSTQPEVSADSRDTNLAQPQPQPQPQARIQAPDQDQAGGDIQFFSQAHEPTQESANYGPPRTDHIPRALPAIHDKGYTDEGFQLFSHTVQSPTLGSHAPGDLSAPQTVATQVHENTADGSQQFSNSEQLTFETVGQYANGQGHRDSPCDEVMDSVVDPVADPVSDPVSNPVSNPVSDSVMDSGSTPATHIPHENSLPEDIFQTAKDSSSGEAFVKPSTTTLFQPPTEVFTIDSAETQFLTPTFVSSVPTPASASENLTTLDGGYIKVPPEPEIDTGKHSQLSSGMNADFDLGYNDDAADAWGLNAGAIGTDDLDIALDAQNHDNAVTSAKQEAMANIDSHVDPEKELITTDPMPSQNTPQPVPLPWSVMSAAPVTERSIEESADETTFRDPSQIAPPPIAQFQPNALSPAVDSTNPLVVTSTDLPSIEPSPIASASAANFQTVGPPPILGARLRPRPEVSRASGTSPISSPPLLPIPAPIFENVPVVESDSANQERKNPKAQSKLILPKTDYWGNSRDRSTIVTVVATVLAALVAIGLQTRNPDKIVPLSTAISALRWVHARAPVISDVPFVAPAVRNHIRKFMTSYPPKVVPRGLLDKVLGNDGAGTPEKEETLPTEDEHYTRPGGVVESNAYTDEDRFVRDREELVAKNAETENLVGRDVTKDSNPSQAGVPDRAEGHKEEFSTLAREDSLEGISVVEDEKRGHEYYYEDQMSSSEAEVGEPEHAGLGQQPEDEKEGLEVQEEVDVATLSSHGVDDKDGALAAGVPVGDTDSNDAVREEITGSTSILSMEGEPLESVSDENHPSGVGEGLHEIHEKTEDAGPSLSDETVGEDETTVKHDAESDDSLSGEEAETLSENVVVDGKVFNAGDSSVPTGDVPDSGDGEPLSGESEMDTAQVRIPHEGSGEDGIDETIGTSGTNEEEVFVVGDERGNVDASRRGAEHETLVVTTGLKDASALDSAEHESMEGNASDMTDDTTVRGVKQSLSDDEVHESFVSYDSGVNADHAVNSDNIEAVEEVMGVGERGDGLVQPQEAADVDDLVQGIHDDTEVLWSTNDSDQLSTNGAEVDDSIQNSNPDGEGVKLTESEVNDADSPHNIRTVDDEDVRSGGDESAMETEANETF